jgi:hypothetical protein
MGVASIVQNNYDCAESVKEARKKLAQILEQESACRHLHES